LKLKYDELLSSFAFNLDLVPYMEALDAMEMLHAVGPGR
jgi:hypothetical protein